VIALVTSEAGMRSSVANAAMSPLNWIGWCLGMMLPLQTLVMLQDMVPGSAIAHRAPGAGVTLVPRGVNMCT
jgi:hypothetical protein